MSELYGTPFEGVRQWQLEHSDPQPAYYVNPYWDNWFWKMFDLHGGVAMAIESIGIDPFIESFKQFFLDIYNWINAKWDQLWTWLHDISTYIESLWNSLGASAIALYEWIGERLESLMNMINNWGVMLWEWLISDIWAVVDYLIAPLREIWDYLTATLAEWFATIQATIANFFSDPFQWVLDLGAEIWDTVKYLAAQIWDAMIETANAAASWIGEKIAGTIPVLSEYLREILAWFWDWIKDAYVFVKDNIIPAVYEATSGALGYLKDEFTHLMGLAYDEILGYAESFAPMTPERAVSLGAIMFGSAVGFGALAHGIALSVEAIPNLKYMGVHYISAFAARMGGFGAISAATMGVIAAVSLRRPMTYYMQSLLRPMQPMAMDLKIMAVKPDIPMNTFRKQMAYEGYSDYWIDRFEATMFTEPRYFELSMMGEDEGATPDWLYLKARRSGYTEEDAKVFVSSLLKKVTRTQRQDYYKQAFNAYKEGYIDESQFKTHLDDLDMRPEAQELAISAAELAYRTDLQKDLVGAYQTAYRNDLISEEEFTASLSALGLIRERVDTLVYLEWVRKTPSALKAERREIEKEWREVQKNYTSIYIESFRRGLITEEDLATYLIAIGIKEEVARATARYEAIKKVPKVKIPEVLPPAIPPPPSPPVYEE